jgi:hypothetical protein
MAIKQLVESGQTVEVQQTTFSLDVIERYVCNTLPETVNNGGLPFDVVVLGAGMLGAYCAEKIYRRGGNKRVLIPEAGDFVVSEHVQNLARIRLNVADAVSSDPAHRASGLGSVAAKQSSYAGAGLLRRWTVVILGRLGAAAHRR